ncbi:MAG: DNA-directed RNA polymerase subunit A'' [Methanobacteriota archaeon]|nr:MAG: DNA-directed RNA polymerase subunit A'' [Euryarchaeota archaeon]
MSKASTVDALRKRGVAKRTAEILANAGFTLEKIAGSKPDRLKKFIGEKDATRILQKVGGATAEKAPPTSKGKAPAGPKVKPKPGAPAIPAEGEAPPELPAKAPQVSKGEHEIYDGLKEIGRYLPRSLVGELATKMHGIKVGRKKLLEVLSRVSDRYESHRIDPNESAGIVSAQSIGEPGTQMSLPYEERIILRDRDGLRVVRIGEAVDELMARHHSKHEGPTEWCDLPAAAALRVPSLTGDGRIVWKPVRSVSRHAHDRPLVRIRTRTGRTVTATGDHSFVTRRGGRITPVPGRSLKRGDRIPVMRRWSVPDPDSILDMSRVLPKEEFWYGSELGKARALGRAWRKGFGRDFVVPVGPDMLMRHLDGRSQIAIDEGFVYPYQNHSRARIPERLPLDPTLGWLLGAYLSEGWAARYYVNISNSETRFLERTRDAARRLGLHYGEYDNRRGFSAGHDLHVRSTVLATFLQAVCGVGSSEKRVPEFAYSANDACASALLRAYFEGDGNVSVARGAIRVSSNSKELVDGIALLLCRFGILSSKGVTGSQHTLWIPRRYAARFRDEIGFESVEKVKLLQELCSHPSAAYTYDALDIVAGQGEILRDLAVKLKIPTRHVNNFTRRQRIGRATLARYMLRFEARARELGVVIDKEMLRLQAFVDEDVTWDEVLEVEELSPPDGPVYDLSVPGLETFTTAEGIVTHNTMRTFHYAGVAEMNVTLGLPRLIEIVDARRVPSTPIMEIHIKEGTRELDKMRKIAQEIEMTNLEDITDIETDLVNMQVLIFPDDHRMKARGVTHSELEEKLRKFATPKELKRTVGTATKVVKGFVVEAGEASFKKLQRILEQMKGTRIKGIDGIRRAIIRRRGERYVLYTEGSNLAKVLELPYADPSQTTTNSIQEIYDVLGVEAARNSIIKEAYDTLQEQGLTVDIRHIMLVSDMMTNDGDVKAIGRHGISGRKSSVLARAAFEITAHHLLHAAITGEVDALDGVAENVIVGQPVTLGTGAVNLVYQPPKLAKPEASK